MSESDLEHRENKNESDSKPKYPGFLKGNKARLGKGTPEDIKELRALTRDSWERSANKAIHMSIEDLLEVKKNPKTTALDMMIVSVLIKAIKDGDEKRLNFFLDRLIGKVVQPLTLQPAKPPPEPVTIQTSQLSDEALNELMGVIDVTPVK